jgi:hypothetical protein
VFITYDVDADLIVDDDDDDDDDDDGGNDDNDDSYVCISAFIEILPYCLCRHMGVERWMCRLKSTGIAGAF